MNFRRWALLLAATFSLSGGIHAVLAAQTAIIKVEKAPVFADLDQKIIIGILKRGRTIRVGDHPRGKGTVLPIIVARKLAYVRIDDLILKNELDEARFQRTRIHENPDADLIGRLEGHAEKRPRSIGISMGSYQGGSRWNAAGSELGLIASHPFLGESWSAWHAQLGIDFFSIGNTSTRYRSITLCPGISRDVFQWGRHRASLRGTLRLPLLASLTSDGTSESVKGIGVSSALDWEWIPRFIPNDVASIVPSVGYQFERWNAMSDNAPAKALGLFAGVAGNFRF